MTHQEANTQFLAARAHKALSEVILGYEEIISYLEANSSNTVFIAMPGLNRVVNMSRTLCNNILPDLKAEKNRLTQVFQGL